MYNLSEHRVICPYCGEPSTVLIDQSEQGQEYIEDCQICCRPIVFSLSLTESGESEVSVRSEDDSF